MRLELMSSHGILSTSTEFRIFLARFRAPIGSASRMNNNSRVFNVSRGFTVKHKQAVKAIKECACTWVDYGVSIRDLTLAESIAANKQQAYLREPLAYSEIFGLRYEPCASGVEHERSSNMLIWAACKFAAEESVKV
jgi:hypothetical protein